MSKETDKKQERPASPWVTELLADATEAINGVHDPAADAQAQVDTAVAALDQAAGNIPAPYVYDTETTEMARTFVNQIDRLNRLISEDDTEIAFTEKDRDRRIHELQLRYEEEQNAILNDAAQMIAIANARRTDRVNARNAAEKVVEAMRSGGPKA